MRGLTKIEGGIYEAMEGYEAIRSFIKSYNPSTTFVLVDNHTKKVCLPYFLDKLSIEKKIVVLEMPNGENHKNIKTCLQLWQELSNKGADRKSLLLNLGGGVVTDLGGFIACTFKRGIQFINIPTTLLAMVDASVGGKNGVDLGSLKNQIGVIKQPNFVIIDTEYLKTLSETETRSGFAEIIKHGLITSKSYWNKAINYFIVTEEEQKNIIWESIKIKNKVVTKDPLEKGVRKTLNYGHTLGHAIESYYLTHREKRLLHGEAIAVGMILANFISSELLQFPKTILEETSDKIISIFGKVTFNDSAISEIIKLLIHDKKNVNGEVRFVLLTNFGEVKTDCKVPNSLIHKAFEYYKNL
ncbi:3-dehydroquinate synthase [Patiriisocius hiemis]|uniref:3-dehydroquinate synthase n=1 Tax=Patiriisocius hiemis TaxID=3075604 RepID=A0ABU2YAL2_9FLAO|nr:3-dehydroquinate synthase [Constantimarinum sp. W242]MDT0554891.1 3-dehydroquinate synthase [Constantimarinum sp. W242]